MTKKSQAILDEVCRTNFLQCDIDEVMSKKKDWLNFNGRWVNYKDGLTKEKIAKRDAYYKKYNDMMVEEDKENGIK